MAKLYGRSVLKNWPYGMKPAGGKISERANEVLERLKEYDIAVHLIEPTIVKYLKKNRLITIVRKKYGLRRGITCVSIVEQLEEPEVRVPQPFKKRREDLDKANLRYIKSQ